VFDEFGHGLRFGGHPCVADDPAQQCGGVGRPQPAEAEPAGAVPDDKAGQPRPAGHHDKAARAAGQQRLDLFGVAGVVEHQQHPLAVHHAPEQCGAVRVIGWNGVRTYTECAQET
jgi:hypothetical protein